MTLTTEHNTSVMLLNTKQWTTPLNFWTQQLESTQNMESYWNMVKRKFKRMKGVHNKCLALTLMSSQGGSNMDPLQLKHCKAYVKIFLFVTLFSLTFLSMYIVPGYCSAHSTIRKWNIVTWICHWSHIYHTSLHYTKFIHLTYSQW